MSTSLVVNGVSYLYPDTGDQSWGTVASAWAAAVTSGMLQKAGGTFALTANANFGTNFGLLSKHFTSVTASAASTGVVRLASTESISWRNNANGADIALAKNSSDQLTWAGVVIASSSGVVPVTAGGTGLTGGTSGGVPYYSAATTMASSAALANHGVVLGGGAGAAPATLAPNASTAFPLVSGGLSANPSWALLTVAGGGTGLSSTSQNFAFIGPTSGSGAPTWRALVAGDIPSLTGSYASTTLNNLGTTALNASLTFAISNASIAGRNTGTGGDVHIRGGQGSSSFGGNSELLGGLGTGGGTEAIIRAAGQNTVGGDVLIAPGVAGATPGVINLNGRCNIGDAAYQHSLSTATQAAAAGVATLTNFPVSGNPAGFIKITVNGVTSYLPYWQ